MEKNIPVWLKPGIWGAVLGVMAFVIIGFSTGWLTTHGAATERADAQEKTAVTNALSTLCVARFKLQTPTNQSLQLAALKEESSYKRREFVASNGWATTPGSDAADNDVAGACADELMAMTAS
ncbi:MAG: hypothetical protein ABID63_10955 [Pseudomonadota bacterium]